jgi:hypothetical protein
MPRPDYLCSFFRAAAAGDGLESLVLLAILTRVGKPKIDIAIQAHVWVILGCRVERISIWRYPYFVHESHPFCGPRLGVCHHRRGFLRWLTP